MGNQAPNSPNDFKLNGQINNSYPVEKSWVPSAILIKQSSHEEFSQKPEIRYDQQQQNQENQRKAAQSEQAESGCRQCLFSSCMESDNVIHGFSSEEPNRRNTTYASQAEGAQEEFKQMNPQVQYNPNFSNNINQNQDCCSGCGMAICEVCGDAGQNGACCQNCDLCNVSCNFDGRCEGDCDCGGCDCGGCDLGGCDLGGCC